MFAIAFQTLLGPNTGPANASRLYATLNVGEGSRQSNAGGPKRWLMRSALRLGKRGCSRRRIVIKVKPVQAEEGAPFNAGSGDA